MAKSTKARPAARQRSVKAASKKSTLKVAGKSSPRTASKKVAKGASKPSPKPRAKASRTSVESPAGKASKGVTKSQGAPAKPAKATTAKGAAALAEPRAKTSAKPSPSRAVLIAQRRKQHEHFRDILLEKQREQVQAYNAAKGDSEESLDNGTEDYIDYAVNSYAREFLLSLTEMDRQQLLQIEDALRRIDRGEYGRCQQCGEPISPRRLDVQPWARHCVRCQELEEQGLLPRYPFQVGEEDYGADVEEEEDGRESVVEEELGGEAEEEEAEEPLEDAPLAADAEDAEE